ncbi:hypothetical protein ACFOZ0_24945 [Streptomyces yaanensis]|uniref:Uncharacterized protein n=1 Tax=Streptomyces yaanensis TaxID=1142239 RepID=A0ABV7SHL5_9ACTN|nr:hypothetical protein [Streptomyces sp. CGMCC 4.7035]WNC01442.1 hypothetical protein Q2K21_27150 [Streptomyces sp. CGMCC 4.7035]
MGRGGRDDLITKLVQAEVDGQRMTDEEVITFSAIRVLAGHVTTTLLLGTTVRCLDENPWVVDKRRGEPDLVFQLQFAIPAGQRPVRECT